MAKKRKDQVEEETQSEVQEQQAEPVVQEQQAAPITEQTFVSIPGIPQGPEIPEHMLKRLYNPKLKELWEESRKNLPKVSPAMAKRLGIRT